MSGAGQLNSVEEYENPFNNPIARARYDAGDMSDIKIIECCGFRILGLIDNEEPSGYLHLHNEGDSELSLIEMDGQDMQSFERLREPIN